MRESRIERVHFGTVEYGEDLLRSITSFVSERKIHLGFIVLLGGLRKTSLAYYDQNEKVFRKISCDEPVEIVSCYGNITLKDGNPHVHLHLIGSKGDGSCIGGHVTEGCEVFAAEFFVFELSGEVERKYDERTGLYLWDLR
ncbi:MAG: uncharacterized protein PWR13_1100 [Archaeoglobi archaeon]|nr:DUF296 domain-containing protein [Candidatus Mnemosynella bozhongmuii]MDK2782072.1 uncharacterized protein [Archaeoglobi archaeon]